MKIRNGYRGGTASELDEALRAYPIDPENADSIRAEWEKWSSSAPRNNGKVHRNGFMMLESDGGFWNLTFSRATFEGNIDAASFIGRQENGFTVYRNSIHKTGKY